MHTEKDAEIVGWIGRVGAAGAEHVMGRFEMSRSSCLRTPQPPGRRMGCWSRRSCSSASPGCTSRPRKGCAAVASSGSRSTGSAPAGSSTRKRSPPAAVSLHQGFPGLGASQRARDPRAGERPR